MTKRQQKFMKIVKGNFQLWPGRIVMVHKLKNLLIKYITFGHIGSIIFTWEQPKTQVLISREGESFPR